MEHEKNQTWWFRESDSLMVLAQTLQTIQSYVGILCNLFIILVVSKPKSNIQRLLGVLAFADICYCLSDICDSSMRLAGMVQTRDRKMYFSNERIPIIVCLAMLTPHMSLFQMALQQPATCAIAFERFLAVFQPFLYHEKWKVSLERKAITTLLSYSGIVLAIHYVYLIAFERDAPVNVACVALSAGTGLHFYFAYEKPFFCGIAVFLTVCAVVKGKQEIGNVDKEGPDAKLQNRLTRTAIVIVTMNTVLIIGPSLAYETITMSREMASLVYTLVGANSVLNLPVLLLVNSAFRDESKALFGGKI